MKNMLVLKRWNIAQTCTAIIALIVCAILLSSASCPPLVRRGGPAFDGSAKWAENIAQPLITAFAADAKVYVITGAVIQTDGRLFANRGGWDFWAWSQGPQRQFIVHVKYDGTATTRTEDKTAPPGRGQPIPMGWLNSTDIFQSARSHVNDAPDQVTMALFNWDDYSEAPGQAVWGLMYSGPGGTHKVRWDGAYLQQQ